MLFIGDDFDKLDEIHELYVEYISFGWDSYPVVWARGHFQDFFSNLHDTYIRPKSKDQLYEKYQQANRLYEHNIASKNC